MKDLTRTMWFMIGVLIAVSLNVAMAEETPSKFKDSDIKRKLKDGKVQTFDGNKYKIVPRGVKSKPIVVTKTIVKKAKIKKNRVSLLAGASPSGKLERDGNEVSTESNLNIGLQYQRLINDNVSIGIQVQTNESVLGSIGLDF